MYMLMRRVKERANRLLTGDNFFFSSSKEKKFSLLNKLPISIQFRIKTGKNPRLIGRIYIILLSLALSLLRNVKRTLLF